MNYYNEYDKGYLYRRDDFEKRNVCFLVLAAVVMKADSIKINHSELNFMKQLFLEKCGERIAKAYILKLRDVLKEEKYDMEYTYELFRRCADYIDYKATVVTLFVLASIDGEIGIPEFLAIWNIGEKLGVSVPDMHSILSKFRTKIIKHISFGVKYGKLYYNIDDLKDNDDSEKNNIVKEAYRLLEIDENATDVEVIKAYRKMAKRYHPDLCDGKQQEECEKMMQKLNHAHDIIISSRNNNRRKNERA